MALAAGGEALGGEVADAVGVGDRRVPAGGVAADGPAVIAGKVVVLVAPGIGCGKEVIGARASIGVHIVWIVRDQSSMQGIATKFRSILVEIVGASRASAWT